MHTGVECTGSISGGGLRGARSVPGAVGRGRTGAGGPRPLPLLLLGLTCACVCVHVCVCTHVYVHGYTCVCARMLHSQVMLLFLKKQTHVASPHGKFTASSGLWRS